MLQDFEEISEVEVDETMNDMHYELIIESIMEQLNEPFNTYKYNNFLKIYEEKYNLISSVYENEDVISKLRIVREETYLNIILYIERYFGFELNKDEINIYDVGRCLYEFFVIGYYKSMVKFFINFINKNKKSIAEYYKNNSIKDVSTSNLRKRTKDKNMIIILLHIQEILLEYVKSYNMDHTFLKYITDFEDSPIYDEIDNIFNNGEIVNYNDNLFNTFFKPLFNKDDGYTSVIIDVHNYLFKQLSNVNDRPSVEDLIEQDEE